MRAKDFIFEKKEGKLSKRQQQPTRGVHRYGDSEHVSGDYTAFKLGQAVAMADGSGKPLDMDAKSWVGKRKTVHPYSQVEADMLKQAYKAVGADWEDLNHGDMNSEELDSTNTHGPVPDRKKLKK
jgi:hypothetical protein